MTSETNKILQDIESLIQTPGYLSVLAWIISQDMFYEVDNTATINLRELISYKEASFLFGLLMKQGSFSYAPLNLEQVQKLADKTRDLMKKLQQSYVNQLHGKMKDIILSVSVDPPCDMLDADKISSQKQIFNSKEAMVEAIFYSGNGAYDAQYSEMASKIYQFDQSWLASKGLNLNQASAIYKAIKLLTLKQHHLYLESNSKTDYLITKFIFHSRDILDKIKASDSKTPLTEEEIVTFISFFVAEPGQQNQSLLAPGDLNIIHIKPILQVKPGSYFIPFGFNLAEAIYQNPGYLMMQDKKYLNTAAENRGKANEEITFHFFKKIFKEKTFKSVKIVKGKQVLTDVDVMGIIGNKAIISQNKSKRMTIKARQGDEAYLEKDFKQAIQDAYNQGLKSREAILQNKGCKFIDDNGDEIVLPQEINQVYILCVTVDEYPAVLLQTLTRLDKKVGDPWPPLLNLFNLDLLVEYLPDPYDFAFYISQRINLAEKLQADNEIDLLAYHLKRGISTLIQPGQLLVVDPDWSQLLDADYMYRKFQSKKPSKENSLNSDWSNQRYDCLLTELKAKTDNPHLVDIIFFLKTLPPTEIDSYVKAIDEIRQTPKDGCLFRTRSLPVWCRDQPWGGITYVTASNKPDLKKQLQHIVEINKYKHKVDKWLGIGSTIGQSNLVDRVLWLESKWQQTDAMDKRLKHHDEDSPSGSIRLEAYRLN